MLHLLDHLTKPIGNHSVPNFASPRIWYLVFADEHTCQESDVAELPQDQVNFIYYDIQLLNPDALGNAKEHFSDEETGIFPLVLYIKKNLTNCFKCNST